MSDELESVGDVLTESNHNGYKTLAVFLGLVVYAGGLVYAGLHNWQLFSKGLPEDLRAWALLGVVSLELSAVALPLGLHFWFHSGTQRIAALIFYLADLFLLILNVIGSFALTTGDTMPAWLDSYLFFAPALPIVAACGWSVLWLLDPAQRERAMIESLRAATRETLSKRIATQARAVDVSEMVDRAAEIMARDVVSQTLGVAQAKTNKRRKKAAAALPPELQPEPIATGNGHGRIVYNAETPAPEAPELEQAGPKGRRAGK